MVRRLPHIFDRVSFLPLKFDHHVVWDVHDKYLQYSTAPLLSGKILHVINRLPHNLENRGFCYFSELENIFSLLSREVLKSTNYENIKDALKEKLNSPYLKGLIFQSEGALKVNLPWLDYNQNLNYSLVTVVPEMIEKRKSLNGFVDKNSVKFLVFSSRFYEKGLHILFDVARKLSYSKRHYQFTLITPTKLEVELPGNIKNVVIPRPSLDERRELYTNHDYVVNLSLGDSLGVFLDSIRFGTPMIGYCGQHGKTYCNDKTSIILENPIFVYGEKFLVDYNMFEYEKYLEDLEGKKFFEKDKLNLFEVFNRVDDIVKYKEMLKNMDIFSLQFSSEKWYAEIKKIYNRY